MADFIYEAVFFFLRSVYGHPCDHYNYFAYIKLFSNVHFYEAISSIISGDAYYANEDRQCFVFQALKCVSKDKMNLSFFYLIHITINHYRP